MTLPGTGGSLVFKYNGFGRRVQKAFTQSSTTTTTNYLYDGDNAVADVDQNGSVLARYTSTQNIDELLAELRSSTTSYYSQDGLGSVTSLSTSVGALGNTYTYDSFGKLTASTGSVTNRFQYTGREFDSETGLYFDRARYYDPSTGRFLTEDPARLGAGVDFYVYVLNRPTLSTDPFGLCPDCFAQLKYRPSAPGSPLNHLYWYIQDSNGRQWYITAGPWGPTQTLNMWKVPDPQPNNESAASIVAWTAGPSADLCDAVEDMLRAVDAWPQDTIPYNPNGPNSNSGARSIGQAGGFYPPTPPGSTGWGTALPTIP